MSKGLKKIKNEFIEGLVLLTALGRIIWRGLVQSIKLLVTLLIWLWRVVINRLSFFSGIGFLIAGTLIGVYGLSQLYSESWIFDNIIRDFYANASTELISIAITVIIIDYLNKLRQDKQFKDQLIRDMGGLSNEFALRAVRELAHHKWLYDGSLRGAELERANLQGAILGGANLTGANLKGANLSGTTLKGANLSVANLWRANLRGAYLERVDLRSANLDGVDLRSANLWRPYLEGVSLKKANLEGTNLIGANLEGANLEGANLKGARLRATIDIHHIFMSPFIVSCWLEGANLEGANLEGAILEGANLRKANLKRANLEGAELRVTNLREAQEKILDNLESYLGSAWWQAIKKRSSYWGEAVTNLERANLIGANLEGAKLEKANLRGAIYNWRTVWPKDFKPEEAGAILDEKGMSPGLSVS